MLQTLQIENIALIQKLEMDFSHGFHALTGETGAGKSILIDSIGLLLGAKADKTLIRTGESQAYVTGLFVDLSSHAIRGVEGAGYTVNEDGSLLIERVLSADGKTKVKINGSISTIAKLKEISKYLIDIHGQTDTLALYDTTNYIRVLDEFSHVDSLLVEYREIYTRYSQIVEEIQSITKSESERLRLVEMLTYQVEDIDAVAPKVGEDDALEEKERLIKNSERIFRQTSFAYRALKGGEKGNVLLLIERSQQALEQLQDVIPDVEGLILELKDCRYRIEDVAERAQDLAPHSEGNPTQLIDKIEHRLAAIAKLKKKYGATIEEILAYREGAKTRLDALQNAEDRLIELQEKKNQVRDEALQVADALHKIRLQCAKMLSDAVVENLVFLDMPKVSFQVSVTVDVDASGEVVLGHNGYDVAEFFISANQGEQLHSLSKVASGGELARIMLALKCVEQANENTASMIFDEIDAGVSGKTARKIGLKLLELSQHAQVLCVTHSAQIASLADVHWLIAKHESVGRTHTTIQSLDEEGRIVELSRVLGGIHVTEAQRQAAIDMRKEKNKSEHT